MAPGGRIVRQTTLTRETIQATQSPNATNADDSTRIRRGRGKTKGKGLEKIKKTTGKKMTIEIPVGKGRPVNAIQSAKLSNELGIIARNHLSLPNKWKELTREEKDGALIRCHERFDIKLDEHYVKDSCEDILKNRSRQWRYKLKKLFESANSEEEARQIEVPGLTAENWNKLCDMWADPEHKKRCEINKVNRTKLKSNHFMGSKAFVAARAEIGEEANGEEPNRIEFYKRTYHTKDKGWSSLEAENNYNQMQALRVQSVSEENPMTPDEIVDLVLGKKSGYVKGLGYGPKPSTTRATQRRIAELEDALRREKEDAATTQNDLQGRLHSAEDIIANQNTQIQALTSRLENVSARQEEFQKLMERFTSSLPLRGQ